MRLVRSSFPTLLLIYFFSSIPMLVRANDFETHLSSTYTVSPEGSTKVSHQFTTLNNTREQYLSGYSLEVGSDTLENIRSYAAQEGDLPVQTKQAQGVTTVDLTFGRPVLGLGRKSNFGVEYTDARIASINGRITEITVPTFNHQLPLTTAAVSLVVPRSFGQIAFTLPEPSQSSQDEHFVTLLYQGQDVQSQGISVVFGDQQVYAFNLRYNLTNPTITPIVTQIALAPDTAYQKVFYDKLEPQPLDLKLDQDGNWIATYELQAKQRLSVLAFGKVTVSHLPVHPLPVPLSQPATYVDSQPYWEVDDEKVQQLAQELKTPQAIYEYLVANLAYNYQRLDSATTSRLGAAAVLNQPSNALCLEFTDAFVAIARAAGIPARAVTGYGLTTNPHLRPLSLVQDVLHAWPEYYDPSIQNWRAIDPTWANTTGGFDYFSHFDFNHVALAIQGAKSDQPYPAGYYKFEDVDTRDVQMQLAQEIPSPQLDFEPNVKTPWLTRLGLSTTYTVSLTSLSNVGIYNENISITQEGSNKVETIHLDGLLPQQSIEEQITLSTEANNRLPQLRFTLGTYDETVSPDHPRGSPFFAIAVALVVGSAAAVGVAYAARRLLVSR